MCNGLKREEKNTKFFLGIEKKIYNWARRYNQAKILEIARNFYETLYKSTNPDKEECYKYIENTK